MYYLVLADDTADDLQNRWFRGALEACVLGTLRAGPAYGYEIAGRIEAAGFVRPKGGTLYPILARLEGERLVEPKWMDGDGGPSRKYYGLTPAGAATAEETAQHWNRFANNVSALLGNTVRSRS